MHGEAIATRSKVQISFASANRDPAHFEAPDEFRLDRERQESGRHLAFGWGIHHCLGAPLARMEARVVLEEVLPAVADYQPTGVVERRFTPSERTIVSLPTAVHWKP
jgi:cytochrome P450